MQSGDIKEALDACIQLNHWEMAVSIANHHDERNIHHLLDKYANQLTGDSGSLTLLSPTPSLYRAWV